MKNKVTPRGGVTVTSRGGVTVTMIHVRCMNTLNVGDTTLHETLMRLDPFSAQTVRVGVIFLIRITSRAHFYLQTEDSGSERRVLSLLSMTSVLTRKGAPWTRVCGLPTPLYGRRPHLLFLVSPDRGDLSNSRNPCPHPSRPPLHLQSTLSHGRVSDVVVEVRRHFLEGHRTLSLRDSIFNWSEVRSSYLLGTRRGLHLRDKGVGNRSLRPNKWESKLPSPKPVKQNTRTEHGAHTSGLWLTDGPMCKSQD